MRTEDLDSLSTKAIQRRPHGSRPCGTDPTDRMEEVASFIEQHQAELRRYVHRMTRGDRHLGDEIMQHTWLQLIRCSDNGGKLSLNVGWVIRTARNRFVDVIRSREREHRRMVRHAVGEAHDAPSPEQSVVSREHVQWLLAHLGEPQRRALASHAIEGVSVAETARTLGKSVEATTSLLARSRARLRIVVEV